MEEFLDGLSRVSKPGLFALSILLAVAIGIVDSATGVELSLSAFYLIPVALSAWYVGQRPGMIIAGLCALTWFIADLRASPSFTQLLIPAWNAAVILAFFIAMSSTLSTLKKTIDRENKTAAEIQRGLLPRVLPAAEGFDIGSAWHPARVVSGDYYDVIALDSKAVGICVADVTGHSIPAALLMSNLQAGFRLMVGEELPPAVLCSRLNAFMMGNLMKETYITFFCAILDTRLRRLTYTNAGHCPPLLLHPDDTLERLEEGGLLFGVDPHSLYRQGEVPLRHGDRLLLYTDGATETRSLRGEQYSEERLARLFREQRDLDSRSLCQNLLHSIADHNGGIFRDDVALVAILAQ